MESRENSDLGGPGFNSLTEYRTILSRALQQKLKDVNTENIYEPDFPV